MLTCSRAAASGRPAACGARSSRTEPVDGALAHGLPGTVRSRRAAKERVRSPGPDVRGGISLLTMAILTEAILTMAVGTEGEEASGKPTGEASVLYNEGAHAISAIQAATP